MFKVRWLEAEDYDTLYKWWKDWRWTIPPTREDLPDEGKCGVMVSYDGIDICAGFMYLTNSKNYALIEYIVSNFEFKDKTIRNEGKKQVVEALTYLIQAQGYKKIFTSLKNEGLKQSFIECGFEVGSKNTTELIKIL